MLIRSLLLSAFFLLLAVAVKSQDYKYLYHLDLNLATVPKADAVILGKGLKENNLFRLDCFSALSNVLLMTVHFKDSSLTEIEGPFRSYYFSGKPEKEGNYVKGFEDGVWINWDTLARKSDSTFYKNGTPMIIAKYRYQNKGGLEYYTLFDSLKNTYRTISYNENGGVDNEVFFKGQNGIMKTYTRSGIKIDSLNTREETEPLFPGGEAGWLYYLKKKPEPLCACC